MAERNKPFKLYSPPNYFARTAEEEEDERWEEFEYWERLYRERGSRLWNPSLSPSKGPAPVSDIDT